ncbi:sulfatase-like hydrolase/transferase [Archangium sp.]|uniref:sulfatase-like hydrolase/transferase n=1 Tax=Archangium sp. TaxID=1872627 RepID=UPI002D5040C2|nr:sulfatase-like hydrolase/transferase [Archangium sp.]HYO56459.1 sulfatase-like hydrolase/transferase [Archangium sp.]
MMPPPDLCATWLELTATGAALTALAKALKFHGFSVDAALGLDDLWLVALLALATVALATLGPAGVFVGLLVGTLFYAALWLDAVLFRIFTIELGPGGVGSIILSVLYRELAELSFARRFFAAHRAFATLPAAALLAHASLLLMPSGRGRLLASLGIAAWLGGATGMDVPAPARWRAFMACAALALVSTGEALAAELLLPLAAVGLGSIAVARALVAVRSRLQGPGPTALRHFLIERPRPEPPAFEPRPEHAHLLAPPRPPRPSALHGTLRGQDAVLLTFESVGRSHLAAFSPGGAQTPWLAGLLPHSLRSRHHACVSPTTNNAHLALYTSSYDEQSSSAALRALREAGYLTVYLSAARAADYGLLPLLTRAGFHHVLDRAVLAPGRGGLLPDQALLSEGLAQLAALLPERRPFFLHVHATHTHVPYRVVDGERFRRFDPADDQGRFFNGIEECDWIFGGLLEGLHQRGLTSEPLVIVSSDHGQAFGRLGYYSHGSAVTRDELDVPLLLHHPRLPPREVTFSSHFDVLPTVLDLLGLEHHEPVFGDSLLHEDRRPELLVWAGHPSRATTSHYGLLLEGEKLLVDLVLERCLRMDWSDERVEELTGHDKTYALALASRMMRLRGVT